MLDDMRQQTGQEADDEADAQRGAEDRSNAIAVSRVSQASITPNACPRGDSYDRLRYGGSGHHRTTSDS
jgi:hypothetical protein